MKKKLIIVLIVVLIIIIGFIIFKNINSNKKEFKNNNSHNKDISETNETKDQEDGPEKTKVIEDNYGGSDGVEITYNQYVIASGYSGASDNVYYTRNNNLYHLRISTKETTKLAEGIKKIEEEIDYIKVYKGDNFKKINEDDYVHYVE